MKYLKKILWVCGDYTAGLLVMFPSVHESVLVSGCGKGSSPSFYLKASAESYNRTHVNVSADGRRAWIRVTWEPSEA